MGDPIAVGGNPVALAANGRDVWIVDYGSHGFPGPRAGGLWRIDANTLESRLVTRLPAGGVDVAVAGHSVWVSNHLRNEVYQIDPRSGRIVGTLATGRGPEGLVATGATLWVADTLDDVVVRVDANSGRVEARVTVPGGPWSIAAGAGALWVTTLSNDNVVQIDERTGRVVRRLPVGEGPVDVDVSGNTVWVSNHFDGTLSRIVTG
jgi:sugar lactone lactonase YvrE